MAINVYEYIIYLLNISKEDRNVRGDMINVKHSVYVHALFTYICLMFLKKVARWIDRIKILWEMCEMQH